MAEDLVHPLARRAIRQAAVDHSTIRNIADAFRDHGFHPTAEPRPRTSGQNGGWGDSPSRAGTFNEYADAVDWSDPSQVRRGLNALGAILDDVRGEGRKEIAKVLRQHGMERTAEGRLQLLGVVDELLGLPLDVLEDAGALTEHIERLRGQARHDPPAAISGAKALVESACKRVLAQMGESVDDGIKMPQLTKAAHKALAVDVNSVAPDQAGAEIITSILRNLAHLPIGLAELRNDYGPDHGRLAPVIGLQARHADLAVGAASTYVRFLLDTLAERAKPAS